MVFVTDYRIEDFILSTTWASLPGEVRTRLAGVDWTVREIVEEINGYLLG